MSRKVEVLCPNGHRVNIKVTPTTNILQILEEACTKQGFLPPEHYELRQGNKKAIDVTLSVRFAGIPNHAKLELVRASESRLEGDVTVALQLESGVRLQHAFPPTTSLWEVLVYWEEQPGSKHGNTLTQTIGVGIHPVCVYMQEDVLGEFALRERSLRSLGLTGGRAILRLVHRAVDNARLDECRKTIEAERARHASMAASAQLKRSSESTQHATMDVDMDSAVSHDTTHVSRESMSVSDAAVSKESRSEPVMKRDDPRRPQRVARSFDAAPETEAMDLTDEQQFTQRLVQLSSVTGPGMYQGMTGPGMYQGVTGPGMYQGMTGPGMDQGMTGPGMDQGMTGPGMDQGMTGPGMDQGMTGPGMDQGMTGPGMDQGVTGPGMYQGMTVDDSEENSCHLPATATRQLPFADFKFPESSRGMDLYQNELSEVQRKDFQPCDREKIVFSLDENIAMATADTDLPDDFFEVTESDVKMMYSDMQSKLEEELNKSLMTRTNRLAELEVKMAKYDRATIRVTFPDRMVLQGLFRPQETVFALQKFVMDHLEDKDMTFYLYTSPPKIVLRDTTKTLIEAGLVPMSVVYFGADTKQDHYLSCSVCEGKTSRESATKVLMNNLPSTSAGQSECASTPAGGAVGRTDAATRGAKHSYDADAASKVPKWFKIGKK